MITVIAVCSFGSLLIPGIASAHAIVESTSPVASSAVAESPTLIELRFNEPVEGKLASIKLFDDERREIEIGDAVRSNSDPSRVVAEDIPKLDDGVYVVIWRVTSADGHPVTGAFPFQVGRNATNIEADIVERLLAGLATKSDLGVPLGIAKFLAYLGIVVLIGAVVFSWGSPLASTTRVLGLQMVSLLAATLGSAAVLLLQGAYASGRSWSSVIDSALIADVVGTRLGAALLARLALAAVWVVLLYAAARGASTHRAWMNTTVLAAFGTIATFAVSGHAGVQDRAPIFMSIDAVHLASVSVWAGALVACAVTVSLGEEHVGEAARRFSRLASRAMPLAVVTGAALGVTLVDDVSAITDTTYGRLLIVKMIVVALAVFVGAAARRRLLSRSVTGIRGIVRVESMIVVAVLVVTTFLVGSSPTPATGFKESFGANLVQDDIVVDFQVTPAYVGTAEVHALFSPPGGTLSPVNDVELSLSLPSASVPNIPVDMIELGPNHWSGVVKIPYAGLWRAEMRVTPRKNARVLFTTNVPIKP